MLNFRIADVLRDRPLLDRVARAAGELLARHPDRAAPLVRRWLGDGTRYGGV
jgi:ATP-dependent DNA helicase RecG